MTPEVLQLVDELTADDSSRRAAAAERLGQLGEPARHAAVALAKAAADPAEDVRETAVAALEQLGPPAPDSAHDLAGLLQEQDADIAYWAATLLGRLGEHGSAFAPPLGQALSSHPSSVARQQAAWALGKIGGAAQCALDALREAATSDDPRLARLAKQAVNQIQS